MGLSNYIPSSRISQAGVCTSTTRPASPYEGQMIYETDTDKVLVWNGSAWYANWNAPWGFIDSVTSSSTQTLTGSMADVTSLSKSMSLVQNRRYKMTMTLFVGVPASGVVMTDFRVVVGSTNLDTLIMRGGDLTANRSQHIIGMNIHSYTGSTGSVTIKGQALNATGGTVSLVSSSGFKAHEILVEDIGPA